MYYYIIGFLIIYQVHMDWVSQKKKKNRMYKNVSLCIINSHNIIEHVVQPLDFIECIREAACYPFHGPLHCSTCLNAAVRHYSKSFACTTFHRRLWYTHILQTLKHIFEKHKKKSKYKYRIIG